MREDFRHNCCFPKAENVTSMPFRENENGMPKSLDEALAANRFPAWLANLVEETRPKAQAVATYEAWKRFAYGRYCQLKPDLVDWICGGHKVIPDKSMEYLQANCV
jgi:hypothetical protein